MNANKWESAWVEYIEAMDANDNIPTGCEFVYWCGVFGRRLEHAVEILRRLDPEFCARLGI